MPKNDDKHKDADELPVSKEQPGAAPQGVIPTPPESEQAAAEAAQDVPVDSNQIRPDDEPWHGGPEYRPK